MKFTQIAQVWATVIFLLAIDSLLAADTPGVTSMGWQSPMSHEESWKVLPNAIEGSGQPLPTWARMLAREMPRTAAAFLELDLAQRTQSPIDPKLRAAMRWIAARDNHCEYAQATAKADGLRAGATEELWKSLASKDISLWNEKEKAALDFAHAMTVDSDGVTDEAFRDLVEKFGERQVASMVLLMAYANFQDRLLLCLGAPMDESGPLPPLKIKFAPDGLVSQTTPPPNKPPVVPASESPGGTKDIVKDESPNTWLTYPQLQDRLQKQRERKTRLRIPSWNEFAKKLPEGLMEKPSDIVWYKIAFGYAHELAVPFEIYMRTAGAEVSANWDRPFGNCIFWMVTDAVKCPYCMGHCEMNWEVVGLNKEEIADISRQLAGDDWSKFTTPQQHALAFARKLTRTPWKVDRSDMDTLREGFGQQRAFFIALNTSRYNYMTRISNGFQLTLETGNPFWDYYKMKTPEPTAAVDQPRSTPVTRPEMKRMLEDMKARKERIPLPPLTAAESTDADPRLQGYEGRLGRLFLPATAGVRSYLNFSGSPQRIANNANRLAQEPDPALTLDYGFKTRLFWIASRANNCQYCLGHQESKLAAVGMNDDRIAALDSDWSSFPVEEQAAFALARRLTLQPHLLSDADIDACRPHYKEVQILEMVLSVAGNNAINRWKEGAGIPQSHGGGNFGGSTGEAHSYLTITSDIFKNVKSKVIGSTGNDLTLPTSMDRKSDLAKRTAAQGLADCANRKPRLPMVSEEKAREFFAELLPPGPVPGWIRLLANFPVAGKRQLNGFIATEKELELSELNRAQMAWVIARQNGAWYSLDQSQKRLLALGQSHSQIAELENFAIETPKGTITEKDRALLLVAKNLAASPVILTDAQVADAVRLAGPRDVVQTIHYTAMRSLFDRFTEAAGLPSDQ
jgi:alkylhydroperoxidase family enzyme